MSTPMPDERHRAQDSDWTPVEGQLAVDGKGYLGVVHRLFEGSAYLRTVSKAGPGSLEWAVPPNELKQPAEGQLPAWARNREWAGRRP
ncbi:hypothetical protein ABT160_13075 [Streptomyces sp. NPDC001941]|uniref:hypothetical protein n=1 Tax=Streptomyces sp. NPDC001941 TaxID=3154659 RepID=UPI0033259CBF